jgi:H/ACA ribonucleoprotein complex subunit 3
MSQHIHKCISCSSYTLEEKCPKCGAEAILPRPPKFSLDDKYAALKREAKKEDFRKKSLY